MKDPDEAKTEIKDKFSKVAERSKDADDRLNKFFETPKADEQPEPKPSSDQTTEPEKVKAEVTEIKVEPEVKETAPDDLDEEEALANSKNPERTKAYIDKLKSKLKEKEATPIPQEVKTDTNVGTSVFDIFHPEATVPQTPTPQFPQSPFIPQTPVVQTPYLAPQQQQNIVQQFVDAQGNVDVNGLNNALVEANRRAYNAELAAEDTKKQVARIEENNEIREAHAEFPEIDPIKAKANGTFDETLFNNVQARLLRNFAFNRKERLVDIVREEKSKLPKPVQVDQKKIDAENAQKAAQAQEARRQGPMDGGERQPETDYQSLRAQTRTGRLDNKALDSRLSDYFKTIK